MSDLTTQVLIEIRDEVRGLRGEVGGLRGEVSELRRRQVESEVRFATALTDVVGAVNRVHDAVIDVFRFAERVDDHERRISALEQRPVD
jgi:hypothetical protein